MVAEEPDCELAVHYASSAQGTPPSPGTSRAFADFCRRRSDEIVALARSERVQTNEVRRCACLMPAFCLVSQDAGGDSLSLIDIGAAAGLNLLWDRYRYAYSDGAVFGPPDSTLTIGCEARTPLPGLPKILPGVTHRVGVDIHPIDLGNEDRYRWAMALVWPDHAERARLLADARRIWLAHPPTVESGDVVVRLPALIQAAPPDSALCLYHSPYLQPAESRRPRVASRDDRRGIRRADRLPGVAGCRSPCRREAGQGQVGHSGDRTLPQPWRMDRMGSAPEGRRWRVAGIRQLPTHGLT